jgi:hypothetical protein
MLSDSCPLCYNPLVKSPVDQTIWCAVCNVMAVHEKVHFDFIFLFVVKFLWAFYRILILRSIGCIQRDPCQLRQLLMT